MFNYNLLDKIEPLKIYLCKPNKDMVCVLNGILEGTASLELKLNNQYSLSFTYLRHIITENGESVESNGYSMLNVGMYLFVEHIGFFRMQHPAFSFTTDSIDVKDITAYSIDCELEDKDLVGFKINTGEKDSLENIVLYDNNETEPLKNAYTNLPYDYILFYDRRAEKLESILNTYSDGVITDTDTIEEIDNICKFFPRLKNKVTIDSEGHATLTEYVIYKYRDGVDTEILSLTLQGFNNRISELIPFYRKYQKQLSLIDLAIEKCSCNWSVGEIDEDLADKKFQFDIDEQNIYSFLTQDVAKVSECIIDFDIINRKINIISAKNLGEYSGVTISRTNLLNTINVTCNENSLFTRYNVSGADDLTMEYVNFGSSRIDDISYFLHAQDEHGDKIYVSDDLANKYEQYKEDRELARDEYIRLTKQYNNYVMQISDLDHKVPDDFLNTDYSQYTIEELEGLKKSYTKLLAALITMYKEDYGTDGVNPDGSVNETYIKTTIYWYDYFAYKNILEQIEAAGEAWGQGISYKDIGVEEVLKKINAWKTEWSLYGIKELQSKISAYDNELSPLIDGKAIILKNETTKKAKQWSELNDAEKAEYEYAEINYYYKVYDEIWQNREDAKAYLETLKTQRASLETSMNNVDNRRKKIRDSVATIEKYDRDTLDDYVALPTSSYETSFTNDEIEQINLLYIDTNYQNENILITSLDNVVTTIDVQKELLEDAQKELSKVAQPQIFFEATIENIFAIKEFKECTKDFKVGNYILMQYFDNYYVKLRLTGITLNPCSPTDNAISVTFSNFIKSNVETSDIATLLDLATGSGKGGGSGSSGSKSSGTLGNDIDLTLSDTMLSKLVNSETFGTAVTNVVLDTIDVNAITARSATFGGLNKGTTIVDGKCITTGYIKDKLYNGVSGGITNTTGSVINLEDGKFSFGGGKLKWDGSTLNVDGVLTAGVGSTIGGFTIGQSALYTNASMTDTTNLAGARLSTTGLNISGGSAAQTFKVYRVGDSIRMNLGDKLVWNGTTLSISGDGSGLDISSNDSVTGLSSRITTNANSISSEITNRTNADSNLSSRIEQTLSSISFNITNGSDSSSLSMSVTKENGSVISLGSKTINMDGLVTFTNLSTNNSSTVINGGNITTGTIDASTVTVTNISASNITTGTLNSDRINTTTLFAKDITATGIIRGATLIGGSININDNFILDTDGYGGINLCDTYNFNDAYNYCFNIWSSKTAKYASSKQYIRASSEQLVIGRQLSSGSRITTVETSINDESLSTKRVYCDEGLYLANNNIVVQKNSNYQFDFATAGFITTNGKDLVFQISTFYIPTNCSVSVISYGLRVRQDGSYLYGSSGSGYTSSGASTSISVLQSRFACQITFTFSSGDSNAKNNDAAGVVGYVNIHIS